MIVTRVAGVQHFGTEKKFKKALAESANQSQLKKEKIRKLIKKTEEVNEKN